MIYQGSQLPLLCPAACVRADVPRRARCGGASIIAACSLRPRALKKKSFLSRPLGGKERQPRSFTDTRFRAPREGQGQMDWPPPTLFMCVDLSTFKSGPCVVRKRNHPAAPPANKREQLQDVIRPTNHVESHQPTMTGPKPVWALSRAPRSPRKRRNAQET